MLGVFKSAACVVVGMVVGGSVIAGAVTTTDPVTLCIRNTSIRVPVDDTCTSRETSLQVASAADVDALAARLDAVEAAAGSQADALEDLEARVSALEPPVSPPPVEGFGTIVGTCGVVAPELDDAAPVLFGNRSFDFGTDPYDDPADRALLTPGGQEIIVDGNLGGSSVFGEVFAYETLARCEAASLIKTETEIVYDAAGAKTDLLVGIDGNKVGVSVVRAVTFPLGNPLTAASAATLLTSALTNVNDSSQAVAAEDAWVKQVLVVLAIDQQHADTIATEWAKIDNATRADTVVYVIVTDGSDSNIYMDQ